MYTLERKKLVVNYTRYKAGIFCNGCVYSLQYIHVCLSIIYCKLFYCLKWRNAFVPLLGITWYCEIAFNVNISLVMCLWPSASLLCKSVKLWVCQTSWTVYFRYLHTCEPPIIHGNLTTDTIFIQHNGLIKIGSGNSLHDTFWEINQHGKFTDLLIIRLIVTSILSFIWSIFSKFIFQTF